MCGLLCMTQRHECFCFVSIIRPFGALSPCDLVDSRVGPVAGVAGKESSCLVFGKERFVFTAADRDQVVELRVKSVVDCRVAGRLVLTYIPIRRLEFVLVLREVDRLGCARQ